MDDNLTLFGTILVKKVRDRTISEFDSKLAGQMVDEESKQLCDEYNHLDLESKNLVNKVIPQIVDLCMHNLLCTLEEFPEIIIEVNGDNINNISDGLAGELYTTDGWIHRFSTQRR